MGRWVYQVVEEDGHGFRWLGKATAIFFGWGFLPLDSHDHEDMIWQSLHVFPKTERDYRLQPHAVYASDPARADSVIKVVLSAS